MQNSGYNLKEFIKFLYGKNNYKININKKKLVEKYKLEKFNSFTFT